MLFGNGKKGCTMKEGKVHTEKPSATKEETVAHDNIHIHVETPVNDTNDSSKQQEEKDARASFDTALNPNPRANENVKHAPDEKTKNNKLPGTEITDGEDG